MQTPPALSKTDSSIIWELPKKTKLIYNHKHWSQTHQTLCFQVLQWLRVLEFTFLRNAPRPEFTLDWGLLFQCQTDSLRDRIERPLFDLGWNHQPDYHWAYSEQKLCRISFLMAKKPSKWRFYPYRTSD